jgi:hypothetical protein
MTNTKTDRQETGRRETVEIAHDRVQWRVLCSYIRKFVNLTSLVISFFFHNATIKERLKVNEDMLLAVPT